MKSWQHLEVLQLGPAGVVGVRIGGADLRDHIYSFPISNTCRVEQEWLAQTFNEDDWAERAPYQVKGLDALEHLLFKEGADCECPSQAKIVRDNLWGEFTMDAEAYELTRWAYADAIIADLEGRTEALSTAWQGDFGDSFERAEDPFSAERDAVNQLFAAIFYIDLSVKDRKLGGPTGVHMSCVDEICPEMIEHRGSGFGRAALIANLEGFISVLRGHAQTEMTSEGFGLSALLAQEGATELGAQLEQLAQEAITLLETSELTLSEQLESNPDELRQIHNKTKEITELLKTQVVTTLNLSVPKEGAGDND
jgi:predicted lipoprotein